MRGGFSASSIINKNTMMHLDNKISFIGGFALTTITSVSMVGVFQAALVGLVGGFFGLLGKELYYAVKNKLGSAKFKVWLIGLYDKTIGKFVNWF
jgi:hypothetical protein